MLSSFFFNNCCMKKHNRILMYKILFLDTKGVESNSESITIQG